MLVNSFFLISNRISEVVASVSKQALPDAKSYLTMEIVVNRLEDDEEADVPYVRYKFKNFTKWEN